MTSRECDTPLTILALGSPHGDDQAAWYVIERLQADREFAGRCFRIASPWDVVPHLQGGGRVMIIDACQSGAAPGTLHRHVSPESATAAGDVPSSHGGSLREALQLSQSLGYDLSGVEIHGIEVEATQPGAPVTPAVRRAVETLASELREEWPRT
ncbi:MAG: hydrogenase maturation protease [Planctomycetaceae bacterium]